MPTDSHTLIIGGGPAGLTALYDCARRGVAATCLEADTMVGGISRTIERHGFRFDIGGHRFFSKYDTVNRLWHEVLGDEFLTRPRLSRIFYNGRFFYYPLQPINALAGLGVVNTAAILASYLQARLFPVTPETTFSDWVTNRFGRRLFEIFFKTYTEKLWGIPCEEIQAEWAAQRIKGLSLTSAVKNALFPGTKKVIKTLINQFQYPRFGPGQMYETMADKAVDMGGGLLLRHRVESIHHRDGRIAAVTVWTPEGRHRLVGDHFIATMPITELVLRLDPPLPQEVLEAARGLSYRSLLTVNLMAHTPQLLPDTWMYIHDPGVRVGRLQFFANWSPFMVPSPQHSSVGLEYFCSEGDDLWTMDNDQLLALGRKEIQRLGLLAPETVTDGFVVRMPKCYPVYDGQYRGRLEKIRAALGAFSNLHPCGRYGLFKYNNMDHSIITALLAVENVLGASHDVWAINADDEYHEEKKGQQPPVVGGGPVSPTRRRTGVRQKRQGFSCGFSVLTKVGTGYRNKTGTL